LVDGLQELGLSVEDVARTGVKVERDILSKKWKAERTNGRECKQGAENPMRSCQNSMLLGKSSKLKRYRLRGDAASGLECKYCKSPIIINGSDAGGKDKVARA
jgi:hypothetical protein